MQRILLYILVGLFIGAQATPACDPAIIAAHAPIRITARLDEVTSAYPQRREALLDLAQQFILYPEVSIDIPRPLFEQGGIPDGLAFVQAFNRVKSFPLGQIYAQLLIRWSNLIGQHIGPELAPYVFLSIVNQRCQMERMYIQNKQMEIPNRILSRMPSVPDLLFISEGSAPLDYVEADWRAFLLSGLAHVQQPINSHPDFVGYWISSQNDPIYPHLTRMGYDYSRSQKMGNRVHRFENKDLEPIEIEVFANLRQTVLLLNLSVFESIPHDLKIKLAWRVTVNNKLIGGGLALPQPVVDQISAEMQPLISVIGR